MGISYDGVGGIGIELTEEIIQKLIAANIFTEEEWEDDYYTCLDTIGDTWGVLFGTGGSHYSGDLNHYIFVDGSNLKEIMENYPNFLEKLKNVGVELSIEDLKLISDYSVS